MNPAPETTGFDARHLARHAAVDESYLEPTDASVWATAYSDGADRARRNPSRSHPGSRVERRGKRRRHDRV